MEIYETPLPGIGVRYEFTSESGDHVGVVVRRDGKRDVALYDRQDPDSCKGTMELSEGDSSKLAELLGGTNITARLESLKHMVEGLAIEWVTMPAVRRAYRARRSATATSGPPPRRPSWRSFATTRGSLDPGPSSLSRRATPSSSWEATTQCARLAPS